MTNEDEITESGFLGLQEMAAGDEEGGEAELWQCLTAMGYNNQLKLCQVKHTLTEGWAGNAAGSKEQVEKGWGWGGQEQAQWTLTPKSITHGRLHMCGLVFAHFMHM